MASDLSIKKNAWSSTAQSSGRDAGAGKAAASSAAQGDQEAESPLESSRVTLSNDALNRMLQYGQAVSRMATDTVASKKDLARARVEEIKKRIAMLKKLLAMMGPAAAKGVLREIRQLAGQLSAAAETLKEGSDGMSPATSGVGVMAASAVGAPLSSGSDGAALGATPARADGADPQARGGALSQGAQVAAAYAKVSADTEAADDTAARPAAGAEAGPDAGMAAAQAQAAASQSGSADPADASAGPMAGVGAADAANLRRAQDRQREEDASSLRDVLRELKALLALARQMAERGDEEARKDAAAAETMIEDAARTTDGIALGGVGTLPVA